MNSTRIFAGLAAACAAAALAVPAAHAEPVPAPVAAMIDAAAASGDPATLKTVVDLAKKTNPASSAEIDAQVARLKAAAEQARIAKLSHQSLFQGVKGEGQIGVSDTTGNSDSLGVAVGATLSKETLHWKNTLQLEADYEKDSGVVTEEKFLAAYEGAYKITPRFYALVAIGWSRDTFSGYSDRYGGSVGLGYKVIDRPNLTLSLEAGPAVRRTDYLSVLGAPAYDQTEAAGRAAGNLSWTIIPNTVFTEQVSGLAGGGDDTLISTTAITTRIVGALSARASFLVEYDSQPPAGIQTTDTITRFGLVYGF